MIVAVQRASAISPAVQIGIGDLLRLADQVEAVPVRALVVTLPTSTSSSSRRTPTGLCAATWTVDFSGRLESGLVHKSLRDKGPVMMRWLFR